MLQLLVCREVGEFHESAHCRACSGLVVGFCFDKLNVMHFDCSQTLSLVIIAARDNENEQLKCATSNLSMCINALYYSAAASQCTLGAVTHVHDWD